MDEVQLNYRGYLIRIEQGWSGRFLTISPKSPELPILGRNSRFLFGTSTDEAIEEAQERIDRLLKNWRGNSGAHLAITLPNSFSIESGMAKRHLNCAPTNSR